VAPITSTVRDIPSEVFLSIRNRNAHPSFNPKFEIQNRKPLNSITESERILFTAPNTGGDKPRRYFLYRGLSVVAGFHAKPDDASILIFKGAPYPRLFLR
jgi:hypothetical protein